MRRVLASDRRTAGLWLPLLLMLLGTSSSTLLVAAETEAGNTATTGTFTPQTPAVTWEQLALRDVHGREVPLADLTTRDAVVVAFLGTECPLARLYAPRLVELAAQYPSERVAFLAVNANPQDSVTELAAFARGFGLTFPLLKDLDQKLARQLAAQRTPEVFVLDRQRHVRYRGRIDDQYGFQESGVAYQLAAPRRRDLAVALDELLAGGEVSQPVTKPAGCLITLSQRPDAAATAEVTYASHVADILNRNCVMCHREGQLAPFALTSHEQAAGWAEMIREVVDAGRMPPWHADPRYGHFSNDARLSDADKALLARWVEAGAPAGDLSQAPPTPQFASGWMIPEPDAVVYMRDEPYDVPAEGVIPYERFVVDPGWPEDRWIKAIEPRPGNPAVVHHIVMYIIPPDGPMLGAAGRLRTDWLAAYAPGLRPEVLENGYARFFPKGAKLLFELHYTPNGVAQQDRSYLGVLFADPQDVIKEVAVKNAGNFSFRIPPGEPNFRVESNYTFREETLLLSVSPHMHLRGKDFTYELLYPDGRQEMVLSVPQYDFAWQTTYQFVEPKRLPPGTKLHCVAHFDNSADNLNNPDPTQEVRWGEQTFEEMMFGWFEMARADQDLRNAPPVPASRVAQFKELAAKGAAVLDQQQRAVAQKALLGSEDFKFFCYYLLDVLPQLDRVCVTYVDGEYLRLQQVEELHGMKTVFRSPSTTFKAADQALAAYLLSREPVVNADLNQAPGTLMKKLVRKGFRSSVHVPISLAGRPATVNFWSAEADAFPPEAVSLLVELAAQVGQPHDPPAAK